MAIVRAPFPRLQFKADDGSLMAFCWLKVFIAGTNTQIRTYKNESGTLNPIEIQLDNRGECDVWIDDDKKYRFELWSVDRKRRVKTYNGVSAGYMVEAVPNVNITSPNNTLNIVSSVDPETDAKVFSIDVNGNTIDIIKWSDVLTAEDKAVFETRIQADLTAGIEPIVFDDSDPIPRIATLSGRNTYVDGQQVERFSVFRTATNESNFTNYIPGKGITELSYLSLHLKNAAVSFDSDAGFVLVSNNRNLTYTYTGSNTLDFVVSPIDGMAANFAVKITSTSETDGTVNVYKKQNGIYTPLKPSVAGGTTVEAGKTYQLTCVGDCWTIAEFEEPSAGLKTKIGDKFYRVAKIGSLYWMAENLAYNATAETGDLDSASVWYDNDSSTYGDYGKLYTFTGAARAEILAAAPGWRFPTESEVVAMLTGKTYADIKSATGWPTSGTDTMGFNAKPSGQYDSGNFTGWGTKFIMWYLNGEDPAALEVADDGLVYSQPVQPGSFYYAVRLVKDAQ